jgi:molecular chaperone DnaK (HSP70)
VTFEIDSDGIVQVTAADPATGKAASTTLTLTSGLSGEELENIMEANRTARVAPGWRPPAAEEEPKNQEAPSPSFSGDETSPAPVNPVESAFEAPLFDENPIELALPEEEKQEEA